MARRWRFDDEFCRAVGGRPHRLQATAAALESEKGQDFHYSATHWFLAHCGFKSQALLYPIPNPCLTLFQQNLGFL